MTPSTRSHQWEPIETAPKDGTHILAFGEEGFGVVHWIDDTREVWDRINENTQKRRIIEDGYWEGEIYPTHWMPLPTPPEGHNGE